MSAEWFALRSATQSERRAIGEANIASDHCEILSYRGNDIGWYDDYGSFHVIDPPGSPEQTAHLIELAEQFGQALQDLTEKLP
jgi:hypothetical protein